MNQAVAQRQESAPIVPAGESASILQLIMRVAADPQCDIEKMERLMAMHERVKAQQAEAEFNCALSRVQSNMGRISTDATNSQTRSNYATYGKLDRVLRPIYTAEGFSLSFGTEPAQEGLVGMVCYVSHSTGHTREYRAQVPSDGKGAKGGDVMTKTHAFGSGTSYGMRYLLKMIFNVAIGEEDDDGAAAGGDLRDAAMADLLARVAEADDQDQLARVWQSGVAVLKAARDQAGYEQLKTAVTERGKALEASDAPH